MNTPTPQKPGEHIQRYPIDPNTQVPQTLLRTKLHPPFIRLELVARPWLKKQFEQGLRGPLTLIAAPAGFGKTTLAASFITGYSMPFAWLSLDKDDNQAGFFLNYLVAALQEANHEIGNEAAQLLAAKQVPPLSIVTSLINDLDSSGEEVVLVLDDYQFIKNQAIHESVAFLLEHCPPSFHLVIATRSDPPLPLARLRARGQLVELRAADLRFTAQETAWFLNEIMGLHLDPSAISVLEKRTEGWVAGLQMAALSLLDRKDIRGFIEGFSGTNRYILDYLLEEVLANQSPEIHHFLLVTSILERLTAPLCDALLGNDEPLDQAGIDRAAGIKSASSHQSATILNNLERANLFLVPLDDAQIWYRYHHLFADLLRAQLQRSVDSAEIAQLHGRAAEWHGKNGSILEAIHHASMAGDEALVERYITQNYMELVRQGEQSWIRAWTDNLDDELVNTHPWLYIYEAYSHSWFGELDQADRLLEEAEKLIPAEISQPVAPAMKGLLAYVKSRTTAMRGDIQQAITLCLEARKYVPADNLALQLDTGITLGYETFLSGDFATARNILNETIQTGINAGAVMNTVAASCVLARLYTVQGLLNEAFDAYQKAQRLIPETNEQHLGARALVAAGIADILVEWNDLEEAQKLINKSLDLLPWWGKADDMVLAQVTSARIHLAQGNQRDAIHAVDQAGQLIQTRGVFSEARTAVEIAQVKLWLNQDNLPAASRWLTSQKMCLPIDKQGAPDHELVYIAYGRVLIAQKIFDEAITLFSRLEETARSAGRLSRVIEILLLKALTHRAMGDTENALMPLTECLTLAEPEGYARLFLDEGKPAKMLLSQWTTLASPCPLYTYAQHLLSQYDNHQPIMITSPKDITFATNLVEPLSPRELEVLQIIALGKTNQEVARQLVVAPGTVKAHTANIYRKLDVTNRTKAVARARELGILP